MRYVSLLSDPPHTIPSTHQAHKWAKAFRGKPFPLYDQLAPLVDGRIATGEGVFRAGDPLGGVADLALELGLGELSEPEGDSLMVQGTDLGNEFDEEEGQGVVSPDSQVRKFIFCNTCRVD